MEPSYVPSRSLVIQTLSHLHALSTVRVAKVSNAFAQNPDHVESLAARIEQLAKTGAQLKGLDFTETNLTGNSLEVLVTRMPPNLIYYLHLRRCPFITREKLKGLAAHYQRLADQGSLGGQICLGLCYEKGQGVKRDLNQAEYYWTLAAEQGDTHTLYRLAYRYEAGQGVQKDIGKAFWLYKVAADRGDRNAQFRAGLFHHCGWGGVEKSFEKAAEFYSLAAEKGHPGAQCNLGYFRENGLGIEQNHRRAAKLYKLAAQQGHPGAMFNLGCCFYSGICVKRDREKGIELWIDAASCGHRDAKNELRQLYSEDRRVDPLKVIA